MDQLVAMEEAERDEELAAIQNDTIETQTDVAPELIQRLSQVHAHKLVDKAQMLIVVKAIEKTNAVLFIVRVTLIESRNHVSLP